MSQFRCIVFAADLTKRSAETFRAACALAHPQQTRLFVLHVVEKMPVAEQAVAFGDGLVTAGGEQPHHEALKERLREIYAPATPLDVEYLVQDGDPAEEILWLAREVGGDLIVMGTHGRTGLRRLLAGSEAEAVLRKATCPVLALRPPEEPREVGTLKTILYATDFSEPAEGALRVAWLLARDSGARLILLHVIEPEILVEGTARPIKDTRLYRKALEEARTRVDGPDLKRPAETLLVEGGADVEILRAAEETGADLIVLGTHGRSGLGRLLMGSVAEDVMRRAGIPVLCVKSPAAAPRNAPEREAARA